MAQRFLDLEAAAVPTAYGQLLSQAGFAPAELTSHCKINVWGLTWKRSTAHLMQSLKLLMGSPQSTSTTFSIDSLAEASDACSKGQSVRMTSSQLLLSRHSGYTVQVSAAPPAARK